MVKNKLSRGIFHELIFNAYFLMLSTGYVTTTLKGFKKTAVLAFCYLLPSLSAICTDLFRKSIDYISREE